MKFKQSDIVRVLAPISGHTELGHDGSHYTNVKHDDVVLILNEHYRAQRTLAYDVITSDGHLGWLYADELMHV